MSLSIPREGMMAVVRNRRAMITGVQPFDANEGGRFHIVEVDYTDGTGVESDTLLWEVEVDPQVLEPSALPDVANTAPMDPQEFDAMVRATRWSALTPSLPFSGLDQDRPPVAAPLFGAIYPEAYQLVPVLRALEMPRVALMLADAVGLGKTIQAGMVMRELMLRRRIRRILILCPASLRTQWRDEMHEKFALPFEVVDRQQTLDLQQQVGIDANPWRTHERVIASYHYLKQPDVLEQFRSVSEPDNERMHRWDLLVVDEAHNLAPASFGSDSDLSRMLQEISPWFEHRIFLTATPHNGHTRSFSGLLEMLDPVRFTRKSELDDKDRMRVGESVIRRLKSEINRSYTDIGEPPRFSERQVDALPALRFSHLERNLQAVVHDFRRNLRKVMSGSSHQETVAANFATEVLQKRLLSGPWAFGQSWLALIDGLQEQADRITSIQVVRAIDANNEDTGDDTEKESRQRHADRTVGTWLRRWSADLSNEIRAVTSAVEALGITRVPPGLEPAAHSQAVAERSIKVRADARLDALFALIDSNLRSSNTWRSDERLVIFTEYLATLDYLTARLRKRYGEGPWLLGFFGGMNDDARDSVKKAFNDVNGPARVLVATDAAGEGLNLQRAARQLLHWDIPWNPGRMEQRNGRLDRHGQERDVNIFHFDSLDDASMQFLGKVLKKRSQTREDQVVTDDIFAEAILNHFEKEQEIEASEKSLNSAIALAGVLNAEIKTDLPLAQSLPGSADLDRLDQLRAELDISPKTLSETLETALAIESSRPRLSLDDKGRSHLIHPVPILWKELVDQTIRKDGPTSGLLSLVFDPSHYVQKRSGRPVYIPEPDSCLVHLGDALYHRVMSTFAQYRFTGGRKTATRWTTRQASLPGGIDALVLLTVEELAVNELREACHHWVRTYAFPVIGGRIQSPMVHRPASSWSASNCLSDKASAEDVWDDVSKDLKATIQLIQTQLTASLTAQLSASGAMVVDLEEKRFISRRKELERAVADNQISKLEKDRDKLLNRSRQGLLFQDMQHDLSKELSDLDAEIRLRREHYDRVQARLADESNRTLNEILPHRYKLRGQAHVYPVAVEIRLPGGAE